MDAAEMSKVISVALEPFPWGYIVVQASRDIDDFRELMTGHVSTKELEKHLASYQRSFVDKANVLGSCSVYEYPVPWIVCIIGSDYKDILGTLVHELVHLGENLTSISGTPLTPGSQEVRVRLVTRAFSRFLQQYPAEKKANGYQVEPILFGALVLLICLMLMKTAGFDLMRYLA